MQVAHCVTQGRLREAAAWFSRRRCALSSPRSLPRAPCSVQQSAVTADHVLEAVLDRVRSRTTQLAASQEVAVHGAGKHLGSDVTWMFRFRGDGAFLEEVRSKHLTFRWGHDGGEASAAWALDPCGVSSRLDLDDHEALLLAALVRSGAWADAGVGRRLELRLGHNRAELQQIAAMAAATDAASSRSSPSSEVAVLARLRGGKVQVRVRLRPQEGWLPHSCDVLLAGDEERWDFRGWRAWSSGTGVMYPGQVRHHACAGGVHEYQALSCQTLLAPQLPGGYAIPPCLPLPADTVFDEAAPSGVQGWHTASGHTLVAVQLDGREAGLFILDTGASGFVVERRAADALGLRRFGDFAISAVGGKVQTVFRQAASLSVGPLLIRDPVLMEMSLAGVVKGAPAPVVGILGYDLMRRAVVEVPAAAAAALPAQPTGSSSEQRLSAAGAHQASQQQQGLQQEEGAEVTATSGSATHVAHHCAAAAASGPDGTSMGSNGGGMEACCSSGSTTSSTHGSSDCSSGAAGPALGRPADAAPQPVALRICSPGRPFQPPPGEWVAQPLVMVANLPHVELSFMTEGGQRHAALFMIDSGAGGTDLMFHARAANQLKLLDYTRKGAAGKSRFVKGVGSHQTMRVQTGQLAWVDCGGVRFPGVATLCAVQGGLDISLYSAGTVCSDLLSRTDVAFDYARRQLWLRRS